MATWICINTGSGNYLLNDGTKQLPRAWHIPLSDGPGQGKLSVGQVDLDTFLFHIIYTEKSGIEKSKFWKSGKWKFWETASPVSKLPEPISMYHQGSLPRYCLFTCLLRYNFPYWHEIYTFKSQRHISYGTISWHDEAVFHPTSATTRQKQGDRLPVRVGVNSGIEIGIDFNSNSGIRIGIASPGIGIGIAKWNWLEYCRFHFNSTINSPYFSILSPTNDTHWCFRKSEGLL